jgi:hypothetical protein
MLINHPGSWQQFQFRSDNRGLSVMEMKSKYLHEQYLFENELFNLQQQHQQNVFMNGGGGGPTSTSEPTPEPTYSSLLQLTFNDTLINMNDNYGFDVTSATDWNNTDAFTWKTDGRFEVVEVVDDYIIILKGNGVDINIDDGFFRGDSYLARIEDTNANCVSGIGVTEFAGSVIEDVKLNAMVTLGGGAFNSCTRLADVQFDSLISIPDSTNGDYSGGAFTGCDLNNRVFEEMFRSIEYIGTFAFAQTGITSINSDTLAVIRFRAFSECASLGSLRLVKPTTFGEGIAGGAAFGACSNLNVITLVENCSFTSTDNFNGVSLTGDATVNAGNEFDPNITYLTTSPRTWTITTS